MNQANSSLRLLHRQGRLLFLIVFFGGLLLRVGDLTLFREFNSDKARQLQGAYEFLRGHGISYESYDLRSFQPLRLPIADWPPGYSIAIDGIGIVTGKGMYECSIIFDFINLFVLWAVLFWLTGSLLSFNHLQRILLFGFLGISKVPLQFLWSADFAGLNLFLLSFATMLAYFGSEQNKPRLIKFMILEFLLIACMLFMKYSLLPIAFVPGVALLAYSFFNKESRKRDLFNGALFMLIGVAAFLSVFIYIKICSGTFANLDQRHSDSIKGLHFSNLLYFNPFLVEAFVYLDPFTSRLDGHHFSQFRLAAVLLTALISGCILWSVLARARKGKSCIFEFLVGVTLLLNVCFLTALSLRFNADKQGEYFWTYVKEFRYFAPAMLAVLLYVYKSFDLRGSRWSKLAVIFSLGFALFLRVYYTASGNLAGSFDNVHGPMLTAIKEVQQIADDSTCFVSMTGDQAYDAIITPLVATKGIKVSISYYNYFPPETYSPPYFEKLHTKAANKVLIFFNRNQIKYNEIAKLAGSNNKVTPIITRSGEFYLLIK